MAAKRRMANVLRAVWVLVGLSSGSLTRAEVAEAQPATSDSEYRTLVEQALREYQLGNFSEARAFFARAHEIAPNARTLRGLGMSAYELRNYVEAIDHFRRALDSNERPLTPQMQREVTQLLTQARSFVSRLTLSVQPAHAELRIDTRTVRREPDGSVLLDPGTHELSIEAPDYETTTRTLRTDGSETLTLNVSLHRANQGRARPEPAETSGPVALGLELSEPTLAQPTPPAHESTEATEPTATGSTDSGTGSGAAPWILIGAGGAVAVAGGVLLAVALSNKRAVENPSGNAPAWSEYSARNDSVYPLSLAGIAALGVGAAAAIGGLVWKVTADGTPERAHAQLELTPSGVRVHGSF